MPRIRLPRPLWIAQATAALVVVGLRVGAAEKPASDLPTIGAVTTWGELLDVAPVDLGNGVRIRLGLERVTCPVHGGVFLYCATEGFQPAKRWNRGDLVGPVAVKSLQQRFGLMTGFGFEAAQEQPAGLAKCTLLFLQHVYAVKPGRLQIQVRRPTEDVEDDEPILATATIECTRDAFPPWMPWHQSDDELPIPRQAGFVAANRADGIALPTVMSVRAIVMAGTLDGKTIATERSQPLPELIPRKPTPGFRISEANGLLTVRSEAQFETGDPAPSFLVRWWVNDKPFIPQQVPEDRAFGYLALEGEQPVREVQWRLELDLAKLQAKNGDKVGLQLLHCDDGWEWANGGRSSIRKGWNRVVLPELSNRIEFVAK